MRQILRTFYFSKWYIVQFRPFFNTLRREKEKTCARLAIMTKQFVFSMNFTCDSRSLIIDVLCFQQLTVNQEEIGT